jgi:flagellar biosynthesis protein FlhB
MSEAPDQESKTEHPTEKRVRDAIDKGNVPFSKEAATFGSVVGILAAITLISGGAAANLFAQLRTVLHQAGSVRMSSSGDASHYLSDLASGTAMIVLPMLAVFAIGGILGAIAQNMPSANLERLRPKWERLSPKSNLSQMLGKPAAIELATTFAKVLAAGIVGYIVAKKISLNILPLLASEPSIILQMLERHGVSILSSFALLCLVVAIIDVVLARTKWTKQLMMTRQEVQDEHKQSEGDPHVKQRRKMIGRRRINTRMMKDVPTATMVVVNPSHYAVAMRYVPAEGGAPVVVAKGMDHVALKIRQMCEENRIPVIENVPLARSLHKATSVGSMIPVEFYKAVAEVVHFIEMRKRLRPN